jgi:hypothetical protein
MSNLPPNAYNAISITLTILIKDVENHSLLIPIKRSSKPTFFN